MYCDLPEFRRCCFCWPLRRGVLTLAYASLISCVIEIMVTFEALGVVIIHRFYMALPYELDIALYILEAVATTVLIVGLHWKRVLLVRIYYYFMLGSMVASILFTIVDVCLIDSDHWRMLNIMYFIFSFVLNIYLVLLVRSLVKKLQVSSGNTFGNQLAEFVEAPPTEPDQNGTVTIMREQIPDSTKP